MHNNVTYSHKKLNFLEFDDVYEAISLHRLLHTLKYYQIEEHSFTLHASNLANKVLDGIIEFYKNNNDVQEYENWLKWRQLDTSRLEYSVIVNKLSKTDPVNLNRYSDNEIKKLLLTFYSPFTINKELEDAFLVIIKSHK